MNTEESKAELLQKLARLESINDHLVTELQDLDMLMKLVGFSGGIETVKATALEILEKGYLEGAKDDRSDLESYF